jgi:group II intron reverse transcriptase/maturase
MNTAGGWVLEVDIRKFFDTLSHTHLRELLQHRVRDGVLRRLIGKWLKAGVLEDGRIHYPDDGSPQGGVISPLLANIYLHYVLDLWFAQEVQPRLRGKAKLVRYADDFVILFTREDDARRVLEVLPKRFGKFGLTIHPDKTRLVPFRSPAASPRDSEGATGARPGSFDLLGFTHYWGRSRKGHWVVKRKTASSRFSRAMRSIDDWCRTHRHQPLAEQHQTLSQKLRGHCAYYGITGNSFSLSAFRTAMLQSWRKWLDRRHRQRTMTWTRFASLLKRYPLLWTRSIHSACKRVATT